MAKKIVEIKGLSYSYPDGTPALHDIDLDIFEGDSVGVIGPNGAGKSTLLLHLNGILRANGLIRICGLDVEDKNLPEIRSMVGMVFQDPDSQLFMPTVFDDVAFGPVNMGMPREKVEEAVETALDEVDMQDFRKRTSHHLSFGERRRASIATVLSMNPRLLALDEPSSNLDPKHRRSLIHLLKQLGHTKIIVTHDLDLVLDTCSKVVLLDKGRIVSSGSAREILTDKALLEAHELELPLSLK